MTAVAERTAGTARAADAHCLPAALVHQARNHPKRVALRKKDYGRWKEYDWETYAERTATVMMGLRAHGVTPGDKVAIHAGRF